MLNITATRNSTFLAMPFEVLKNGDPLNLMGATITMVVRLNDCAEPIIELGFGYGLSLVDSVLGKFKIDEQIFIQKKGIYDYSITFDVVGLGVFTWVTGKFIIN